MKKSFSFLLVLVLVFSFTLPAFATETFRPKGNSRSVTLPKGGPYVHITQLEPGVLSFNYGWNSLKYFDPYLLPRGYLIQVGKNGREVWGQLVPGWDRSWLRDEVPEKLQRSWNIGDLPDDTTIDSGDSCIIRFGVIRGWGSIPSFPHIQPNIKVMLEVRFTMP